MQFQNQFSRAPLTLDSDLPPSSSAASSSSKSHQQSPSTRGSKNAAPFPTGLPKRVKLKLSQQQVSQVQDLQGHRVQTCVNKEQCKDEK